MHFIYIHYYIILIYVIANFDIKYSNANYRPCIALHNFFIDEKQNE